MNRYNVDLSWSRRDLVDIRARFAVDFPNLDDSASSGLNAIHGVLFRQYPVQGDTSGAGSHLWAKADRDLRGVRVLGCGAFR